MLEIEIVESNIIDGGIEVFARAWNENGQIGFGKDGTVDIERFRIINPPVLVLDPLGDIVVVEEANEELNSPRVEVRFREDPEEATLQALEQNLAVMKNKHDDTNIIVGKRGNTTTTVYSQASPASTAMNANTTSGYFSTMALAHNATTGDGSSVASPYANNQFITRTLRNATGYYLSRCMWLFDTSAISSGDTISSATLSLYGGTFAYSNSSSESYEIVQSSPASNTTIANSDLGNYSFTSFASIAFSSMSQSAYNDFSLNASGISNVTKAGISKFGSCGGLDLNISSMTSGHDNIMATYEASYTGTTRDPKLVVEHVAPAPEGTMKKATVNASDVPATQTDFPSYVDLSRIGITTQAEADSVRVYADSAKTTEWAREIVSATEMHVKIPSLTSTTDMYVEYDGVSADYAVTDTYGRNAVWGDYTLVSHDGYATESTGYGYTFTPTGAPSLGGATGKLGSATTWNGSQFVDTVPNTTDAKTFQMWINSPTRSGNEFSMWDTGNTLRFVGVYYTGANNWHWFNRSDGTLYNQWDITGAANSTWQMFHAVSDGASYAGYRDGVSAISGYNGTYDWPQYGLTAGTKKLRFGGSTSGASSTSTHCEVRMAINGLSANWVTTEYNNQSDEATFWGTWSDVGGGGANTTNFFYML